MTLFSIAVIPALNFSPFRPSSIPPWLPLRSPFNQALILKHRSHSVFLPLHCSTSSQSSPKPEAAASPSSRIFIKGLSHSTSEGSLAKAFSSFGEVKRVKIILSKGSKQSLGFAYIWFAREEDAYLATSEMDGKFFEGRFISVVIADPESPTKQLQPTSKVRRFVGSPEGRDWRRLELDRAELKKEKAVAGASAARARAREKRGEACVPKGKARNATCGTDLAETIGGCAREGWMQRRGEE